MGWRAAASLAAFAMLVAVQPGGRLAVPDPRAPASVAIQLQPVVTGLTAPVAITHAGDGSGRLFITLQEGRILVHDGVQLLPQPFLDIAPLVGSGGERGLLSVAFHPDYATNRFLYVCYANLAGNIVIARYTRSGSDPNQADPGSALILLTIPHPSFSNHNGGQLQFGPDGYLYAGVGDGGSGGDPANNAQNLGTLLGKLLRLDVDGGPPYIAAGNPFGSEIWALGLRNPWRFSFDRQTGDLFIADVGQNTREEVDFQSAGGGGGQNYCWSRMEGTLLFDASRSCSAGTPTPPILEYGHSLGCSITGGYRYRGARFPELIGIYLYGDYCSGRIWGASQSPDGTWATSELLDTSLSISTFGEGEDGTLYVADHAGGVLYRIVTSVFTDIPSSHWARQYIEAIYRAGVTAGCSAAPPAYCPDEPVTRAQMAVFLLRSKEGGDFAPPLCSSPTFGDVPCASPFASWIEELARRDITAGCGAANYCPDDPVARDQIAALLLKTLDPAGGPMSACIIPPFADVPCSSSFAPWIEELAKRGVIAGCGAGRYCPRNAVTRAELAVLLVRTFGLSGYRSLRAPSSRGGTWQLGG